MQDEHARLAASIRDSGFSALLCVTLGCVLLEAWFVALGARPLGHVVLVSVASILAGSAWRFLVLPHARAGVRPSGPPKRAARLVGAILLAGFGYAGALAFLSGSMSLFASFPACAFLLPWSRSTLCREHIALPLGCVAGACFAGLVTAPHLPPSWQFPVAVWMCWLAAALAWVAQLCYRRRSRVSGTGTDSDRIAAATARAATDGPASAHD